ncbi:hypothetical protein PpBr36_03062 [Pyricularia pennisetigena]|uniref:hypothetical protein n=1 Tax=Pyricularia pennisetigena TaxID=1578925 RepID=UPI0011521D49|nr:hypothetical protein PpBr36_03062 [Pyricularia pennisetigena]TLS30991.1 hypothetical protein PpBr36_03062 [Pyricularia pennisetigena]
MAAASGYGPVIFSSHEASRSRSPGSFLMLLVTLLALLANATAVSINNPIITPDSLGGAAANNHPSNLEIRSNGPRGSEAPWAPRRALAIRPRGTPVIHKRATPPIPSPTAQVTSGPGSSPIHCPADNLTVFTEPSTSKRYVVMCGRDYHSSLGAIDLYNVAAKSLNDCIDVCAKDNSGCTSVGWGYMDDTAGFRCFLKSSIGEPHDSAGWMFAVEDPSQPGNPAPPPSQGLSADAKAGIGVGAAAAVVLMGVGILAGWYYRQRKSIAEQSLGQAKDLSESSSSIGHGSHRTHSPAPPSFQRSLNQMPAGECLELPGSPVNVDPAPGSPAQDDIPIRCVATYLVRQQQRILDSCRPARPKDDPKTGLASIDTTNSQWGVTYTRSPDGTLAPMSAMTGHGSFAVTPWSATQPSPASELPVVRRGPNGYGPEYEMASDVTAAAGRSERAAEKFLLSDMVLFKKQLVSEKAADG